MSEEVQVTAAENTGTQIEGESTTGTSLAPSQTGTVSKYDEAARAQGWVPQDEWQGDPEAWRPAKEFVERGELFGTIHDLRSDNKKIREALTFLTDHHRKVKESEFTRALNVLRSEKKKALEEGDADRLLQVDDAIDIVKTQKAAQAAQDLTSQQSTSTTQVTPVFSQWVTQNNWYNVEPEMREFADEIGVGYHQRNPGSQEKDVYDYVAKRVRQAYPDKFKGTAPRTSSVEGATNTRPSATTKPKLNEEQTRVMKTFVRQGIMTEGEYLAELQRIGAV